jgi:type I restriction enzyme S subunit
MVKPGYKQTEVGVIPEDWEVVQLGGLKPFVTSGSRGWASYYSQQGSLFVRITNLSRESIYLDLTDKKYVKLPPEESEGVRTRLNEHDVLISITADIGIVGYVDASVPSPAYINQHIALVRLDPTQASGKFVSYFLASEKPQRLFRASTDLGAKAGMSLITVQKIQTVFPPLPEQQAIASALWDADELIVSLEQLLTKKRQIKQGAMQELLTGKKRLPGFTGEWEVKKLGEVFSIFAGNSKSSLIVKGGDYWICDMGSVTTGGKLIVSKRTNYSGDFLKTGDLIMPKDDIGGGKIIGRVGYIDADNTYVLSDHVYCLRALDGDSRFLSCMINSHQINSELRKKVIGSAQLGLGRRSVTDQEIPFPQLSEQKGIADVLFDMDAEIEALETKLVKARQVKQGMMQELLTGKTRLISPK